MPREKVKRHHDFNAMRLIEYYQRKIRMLILIKILNTVCETHIHICYLIFIIYDNKIKVIIKSIVFLYDVPYSIYTVCMVYTYGILL